jgi:hypothetical protein
MLQPPGSQQCLRASHPYHSRQTGGLTGNPVYKAARRPLDFPIGRSAAVGNDIDDWHAERRDIVWTMPRHLSGLYDDTVGSHSPFGRQSIDEKQKFS